MVAYNLGIPDGPNNPSNDQPKMKTNTDAIQTLISVDHVGFNTNGTAPNGVGGHHLQVSFDGKNAPLAQTDPQSVLYTGSGTTSTISQLLYRNQNAIFPISALRAFGVFQTAAGPVTTLLNSYNLDSVTPITGSGQGPYVIKLAANVVTGNDVAILVSSSGVVTYSYTFTNPNLSITFSAPLLVFPKVSFAFLQF